LTPILREAQEGPQVGLVAVHVAAGMVDDHRNAALLDEREDVAVAVAADLVQRPLLVVVQAADGADTAFRSGRNGLAKSKSATSGT
jgi:hypothetical protein